MAVPKKKTSKSKRNMRRAHDYVKAVNTHACSNCGSPVLAHNVCSFCNFYDGRNVAITKSMDKI
jgi:large subunit ribosomal protein L32